MPLRSLSPPITAENMERLDFEHPFQCIAAPRSGATQRIYLACREMLYEVHAESGAVTAQWQGKEKCPVSLLRLSHDEKHLAAVTGEDKAVHIFVSNGLQHRNERLMPKRPCAVSFTPDDEHLLCADKFGDVYALTLDLEPELELPTNGAEASPRIFKPAATELTVHSKRNLRALESQLRNVGGMKQSKPAPANGSAPLFKREPILGHVSMLTDILALKRKSRSYIITADRDEHIRVSRGLPQAHVIESFCFGHTQFVSKVCLAREDILISGGGDDFLCVWKLGDENGNELLRKIPLRGLVNEAKAESDGGIDDEPIAVTGLWSAADGSGPLRFFSSCEGIPALFEFSGEDFQGKAIPLTGNPLSAAVFHTDLIVSVDNVHRPGSTTEARQSPSDRLQSIGKTDMAEHLIDKARDLGVGLSEDSLGAKRLANFFYTTEVLRKRGPEDGEGG